MFYVLHKNRYNNRQIGNLYIKETYYNYNFSISSKQNWCSWLSKVIKEKLDNVKVQLGKTYNFLFIA